MLKTLFALFLSLIAIVVFGTIGMVLSLIAPKLVIPLAVRPWGKSMFIFHGVGLNVGGTENIPSVPSVIMYNHQSSFDIPALVASLPGQYKLVMKDEVLKIPFVGWLSKTSGHYFVSRDGGSGDSRQLKLMARAISRKKHTVVLAPEGTRSESGRLLSFKKGGFLLASLSGAPVVPMVIWGGRKVKKKGEFKLGTGTEMTVEFLPPVYPDNFPSGREGMEKLEQAVRSVMLDEVEKHIGSEEALIGTLK